jgi:hypothetical protein
VTDEATIREAVARFVPNASAALSHEPLPPRKADVLAALDRLEQKVTCGGVNCGVCNDCLHVNYHFAKQARDVLVAARDTAIQERDGEKALRRLSEQEAVTARARLERVEAALETLADHSAKNGIDAHFMREFARAALSGVTPPNSPAKEGL